MTRFIFLIKNLAIPIIGALLLQSCAGGAVLVESEKQFSQNPPQIKKIISIQPDFLSIDQRKKVEDVVLDSEELEAEFQKHLIQSAEKNGIELEILAPNTLKSNQIDYFNTLLPLKEKVLFANSRQEVSIDTYKNARQKNKLKALRGIYEYDLEFDLDFVGLAEKYGTPYFSINGMISIRKRKANRWVWLFLFPPSAINSFLRGGYENIYYHVLVDVNRSEILYRELRSFEDPLTSGTLKAMLYDSFNILTD